MPPLKQKLPISSKHTFFLVQMQKFLEYHGKIQEKVHTSLHDHILNIQSM